jgi:peptidoglycan/LPS O-acetylase OafA/YrhL
MRARIPALDGLRAVAFLAVFAYHSENTVGKNTVGGWLGVDVFFALSGFLITGLLLGEIERSGRVDLTAFWVSRAARIIPPLAATCAVVLVLIPSATVTSSPGDIAASLGFFANFRAARHPMGEVNPTWSLAIEEQFYLVWPMAVAALAKRRRVLVACVVAGPASFVCTILWVGGGYGTLPHVWELLAGAALAAIQQRIRVPFGTATVGALVAVAAVAAGAGVHRSDPWTEWMMLAAVAGTLLVIAGAARGGTEPVVWLLSTRPARLVGSWSYCAYLVHLLALHVAGRVLEAHGPLVIAPVGLGLTLAVAAASQRWVERPVRDAARQWLDRQRMTVPMTTLRSVKAAISSQ